MQDRLDELCSRAEGRFHPLFSRFLNLTEQRQAEAAARRANVHYMLFGGAEDAERRVLGVCGENEVTPADFPIVCLKVVRRSRSFGRELTHRDVLGTVMGSGTEREMVGDIALRDGCAYVFCLAQMAGYLEDALSRVGGTDTDCAVSNPPEGCLHQTRPTLIQVASPRLDAVAAHLYRLSRQDVAELVRQGRISVDDTPAVKPDQPLKEGQVLSVRGHGRSRYMGRQSVSKKGKLNILMEEYV